MDPQNIINNIRLEIKELFNHPENVKDYSRFYKDNEDHIGLVTQIIRKLSSEKFKEVQHFDKKQIFELCDLLLELKDSTLQNISFDWAFRLNKKYTKDDFSIFERWIDKYVNSWSSCDDLCCHAFGYFLFSFPEFIPEIHNWTTSKNLWKRRASAVAFIYSARKGKYLDDVLKIAGSLLVLS